jgi:hypothetical protein
VRACVRTGAYGGRACCRRVQSAHSPCHDGMKLGPRLRLCSTARGGAHKCDSCNRPAVQQPSQLHSCAGVPPPPLLPRLAPTPRLHPSSSPPRPFSLNPCSCVSLRVPPCICPHHLPAPPAKHTPTLLRRQTLPSGGWCVCVCMCLCVCVCVSIPPRPPPDIQPLS